MKKKEIQEIYDVFFKCLPANCVKPDGIKIYGDTNKLRKEHAQDWSPFAFEKKNICEKYGRKYPRLRRLNEIHNWKNRRRSRANHRGTRACVGIDNKIIYIYSRVFYEDNEVLASLLHEVGHFNITKEDYPMCGSFFGNDHVPVIEDIDYFDGFIAPELATEEWMWNRWPYVYGKYKKLMGENEPK